MKHLAICDFNGTLASGNGELSKTTLSLLHEYLKKHKLCIISFESYSVLEELTTFHQLSCDFFSLSSSMGKITNQKIYGTLDHSFLNQLLIRLEDFIYTAYASVSDATYIYHYQERLEPLYPTKNRKIIESFTEDIPSLTIALNHDGYPVFSSIAGDTSYCIEILAKDKNRKIIKISPVGYTKEDIVHILHSFYKDYTFIGIGDSITDYGFIKHCEIQIAMKNADPELKSLCPVITEFDFLEDGCMKALFSIDDTRHP